MLGCRRPPTHDQQLEDAPMTTRRLDSLTDLDGLTLHPARPGPHRARRGALTLAGAGASGSRRALAQAATPVASPVPGELTDEERGWLAQRQPATTSTAGSTCASQGAPFERGFQHGYLTAAEYADAIRVYTAMTYQTMGLDYAFFVEKAAELHKAKITAGTARGDGGDRRRLHQGRRADHARRHHRLERLHGDDRLLVADGRDPVRQLGADAATARAIAAPSSPPARPPPTARS